MDIKALSPKFSVSPQILAKDISAIAQAGIRAIICNRPDGEGVDQPTFDASSVEFEAVNTLGQFGLTCTSFTEQQDRFVGIAGDKFNPVYQIIVFCIARFDPALQLVTMFTR